MALIQSTAIPSGATDYELEQSLKFNDDDAYLTWTPSSEGNRKLWTFSSWVKLCNASSGTKTLLQVSSDLVLNWDGGTGKLRTSATSEETSLNSNAVYRDPNSWYHVMMVWDTAQSTASNRLKIYVNGSQITFTGSAYPALNRNSQVNNTLTHYIGINPDENAGIDGYLSEVNFIDGQALTPADFGETGDYGEWKPVEYSGTYGTNGFYLPFKQDYTVEGFSTVTYKGTGVDETYIGGVGFQSDLTWIARRGNAENHIWIDSVRGTNKRLLSNLADAEATDDNIITGFTTDGFTIGTDAGTNAVDTYVAWNWDMGSSNASNTNGTITSTVRANTTYGQSIVTATMPSSGTGVTIGHGLNSKPDMIILKSRSETAPWWVWHKSLTSETQSYLHLNSSSDDTQNTSVWNNTAPTSSVFSTLSNYSIGNNSEAVAYCFHDVTGYSKFGSYTGTGSTGLSVTTGFRPAFVMIKVTSTADSWFISDSTRDPSNPANKMLFANLSSAESTSREIDFDDNGFTIQNTSTSHNNSGQTYIYMAFADKREYAYWLDQSGNNNDWTSNNLTESDISVDSPTNNFATWNALSYDGGTAMTEGNLNAYGSGGTSANEGGTATIGVTSGKWYWENRIKAVGSSCAVGIFPSNNNPKAIADMFQGNPSIYYKQDGNKHVNDSSSSYGSSYTTGDIIGVALNLDDNEIKFYKNNVVQNSGTAIAVTSTSEYYNPVQAGTGNSQVTANFGQDSSFAGNKTAQGNQDGNNIGDFYYTPPTGFLALCTKNLPDVAVVPSEHFNTITYTGNASSSRSITGVGFQPDFVWAKGRNLTINHGLWDSVRGVTKTLRSNSTLAESTDANALTSFNSDGFTANADTLLNGAYNYVAWNWKAPTSFSNDASATGIGDIDSSGKVNVDAGFSIITMTNTGEDDRVAHGLSKAPELVIVKGRATNIDSWYVQTTVIDGSLDYLLLESTAAKGNLGYAAPTATTFASMQIGVGSGQVAYCFHSVDGYSKVGSYTGNGNNDGTFIYLGFRPAFILYKNITDAGTNWIIQDNKRDTYNPNNDLLYPNATTAEEEDFNPDFLSNGLKWRTTSSWANSNGKSYIYIAFAETPFKYSNGK